MFTDYNRVAPGSKPDAKMYEGISFNTFDLEIQSDEIASVYDWEDFFDAIEGFSDNSELITIDTI